MAQFNAWDPVDLRNWATGQVDLPDFVFHDNVNWTVNGVVYEDAIVFDFGGVTEEYYGNGLIVSGQTITGGTITAYYHWFKSDQDGQWYYNYEFRGFSVPGADFTTTNQTALTKSLSGNDMINLQSSAADYMEGRGGNDTIKGGQGNDTLLGGIGGDSLLGGLGRDNLDGGAGSDRLIGNGGTDELTGGAGVIKDVFVFDAKSGADKITDFQDGIDRIEITSGATNFRQLTITDKGADVLVEFGQTSILIQHIEPAAVTDADFLFT